MNFTVSFEKNANAANARKTLTCLDFITDLTQRGWIAKNDLFEIGSWGHINNRNKTFISNIMKNHKIQYNKRSLFQNLSKISLLSQESCAHLQFPKHTANQPGRAPLPTAITLDYTGAWWKCMLVEGPVLRESPLFIPAQYFILKSRVNHNLKVSSSYLWRCISRSVAKIRKEHHDRVMFIEQPRLQLQTRTLIENLNG